MAMSVTYTTINGQIVYENRGGVESYYAPDTLGSTAALLNASGVVTDTFTYQPYGEIVSHVGSSVTPFTYCGTLGYYTDTANSSIYVRARYYRPNIARWQTVDPLWPAELAYSYSQANPATFLDPTGCGCKVRLEKCKGRQEAACNKTCRGKSGIGLCIFLRVDCETIVNCWPLGRLVNDTTYQQRFCYCKDQVRHIKCAALCAIVSHLVPQDPVLGKCYDNCMQVCEGKPVGALPAPPAKNPIH